jgi:hypothetical protein
MSAGPGFIAKGIKPATMGALGQLSAVLTALRTQGHHAIPKFLGGYVNQTLGRLSPKAHKEFHALLREGLKAKGIPLNVGGVGGGTREWLTYLKANPGSQRKAFDAVLDASSAIDLKYGTDIVQKFWLNLIEGGFTAIP